MKHLAIWLALTATTLRAHAAPRKPDADKTKRLIQAASKGDVVSPVTFKGLKLPRAQIAWLIRKRLFPNEVSIYPKAPVATSEQTDLGYN